MNVPSLGVAVGLWWGCTTVDGDLAASAAAARPVSAADVARTLEGPPVANDGT